MAEETDAARDRVIAARADLASELEVMEASLRAAVDIPAKIKRSPAKAAAVVGGIGFLALKGPQRIFGAAKRAVSGPPTEFPPSMLPDQVEKTLRSLGSDGSQGPRCAREGLRRRTPSSRGETRPACGDRWC